MLESEVFYMKITTRKIGNAAGMGGFSFFELGGIAGMLIAGWVSAKL